MDTEKLLEATKQIKLSAYKQFNNFQRIFKGRMEANKVSIQTVYKGTGRSFQDSENIHP